MAENVRAGDKFICYMVRMSRWIGVLEVLEGPFIDTTPIFIPQDDPFIVRFKVAPQVWLPLEQTVPMQEPALFRDYLKTRIDAGGGTTEGCIAA